MGKIVVTFVMSIILLGILFWSFNNDEGIGDAIDDGAKTINNKVANFEYVGTKAPGSDHDGELKGNAGD